MKVSVVSFCVSEIGYTELQKLDNGENGNIVFNYKSGSNYGLLTIGKENASKAYSLYYRYKVAGINTRTFNADMVSLHLSTDTQKYSCSPLQRERDLFECNEVILVPVPEPIPSPDPQRVPLLTDVGVILMISIFISIVSVYFKKKRN